MLFMAANIGDIHLFEPTACIRSWVLRYESKDSVFYKSCKQKTQGLPATLASPGLNAYDYPARLAKLSKRILPYIAEQGLYRNPGL